MNVFSCRVKTPTVERLQLWNKIEVFCQYQGFGWCDFDQITSGGKIMIISNWSIKSWDVQRLFMCMGLLRSKYWQIWCVFLILRLREFTWFHNWWLAKSCYLLVVTGLMRAKTTGWKLRKQVVFGQKWSTFKAWSCLWGPKLSLAPNIEVGDCPSWNW